MPQLSGDRTSGGGWAHFTVVATVVVTAVSVATGCAEKISPNRVERVEITTPTTAPLLVGPGGGESRQLVATARNARGDAVAAVVVWSVATPVEIAISPTGVVTALSIGAGRAVATVGARADTISILISAVPAATVEIAPSALALSVSAIGAGTQQLAAVVRDSAGALLSDRTPVWSSSAPAVAHVSTLGLVTAVAAGTAFVLAVVEGRADSIEVTITVTTGFPPGVDLAVQGAQWTQGVQNSDGTIPILRNGRAAVLNVITSSTSGIAGPSEYALRLFDRSGVLIYADTIARTTPAATTTYAAPTAQFLVPSSLLQPWVRWEVVRDPRGLAPDASALTDRFPRDGHEEVVLITAPVLRLRFVPISLAAHSGVTGIVSAENVDQYLAFLRAVIPFGELEVSVAPSLQFSGSFGAPPQGGSPAFWTLLLSVIDAARLADPTYVDAHWIGIVSPPPGFNSVLNGGWGYNPSSGAAFGPATRTYALISLGWSSNTTWTRELVAHELGHNLGRQHAPCGGAPGADLAFPDANGRIGPGAHNTYAWEIGLAASAPAIAATVGDLMGYCPNAWASAYTYEAILAFRGTVGAALREPTLRERVLLVQGEVTADAVTISAARLMDGVASAEDTGGDWVLEGRDAAGTLLLRYHFSLGRWDHSDVRRPFGVTVRVNAATEAAVASLRVIGPTGAAAVRLP